MRKILITLLAAIAIAAATLPATASADHGDAAVAAPGYSDVALRPTAVEYAVML
jgi:hypothetical protein